MRTFPMGIWCGEAEDDDVQAFIMKWRGKWVKKDIREKE